MRLASMLPSVGVHQLVFRLGALVSAASGFHGCVIPPRLSLLQGLCQSELRNRYPQARFRFWLWNCRTGGRPASLPF